LLGVKKIYENIGLLSACLKLFFLWISKSKPREASCLLTIGLIFPLLALFSISLMFDDYRNVSNLQQKKVFRETEIYFIDSSIDTLDLCIDAMRNSEKLESWYCEIAVKIYKEWASGLRREPRKDYVELGAFGAMRSQMIQRKRSLNLDAALGRVPDNHRLVEILIGPYGNVVIAFFSSSKFYSVWSRSS